ncbi:uncharacterized protein BDZ99DRAFT_312358 [Mytilinidion resinicola]|uniref:Xylanolytic transcriptional activator regulatory domain-containing protein n=1 Tax=Mytilinidion resinicola TaxID=574789 RepID=A0A6A6YNY0_9PEZI|nr:uncharacterized protein BDZ99DRAFT_312358 [Mytilinidion resinicola]KAF2810451.1 hypothetical protein BDZ99DRAFT_312358 [Mytilinidion resinicola]
MTDEQRRLTFLRDNVEHLEEEKSALETLANALKTSSEDEVTKIINQLRNSPDVHIVAQSLRGRRSFSVSERPEGSVISNAAISTTDYDSTPTSPVDVFSRLEQYETLVRKITTASQADLSEIIRRLRSHDNISVILSSIQTESLLQVLSTRDYEVTPGIEADYSSREQMFGLVKGAHAANSSRAPDAHAPLVNQQPWTSVSNDFEFIEHLLSLYFSWQHSFFQSFPEKLFREDMVTGGTRYCSRLLVNALCATGCLLSRRPEARRDPNDPKTAGLDFFDEAVRLLNETRISSIPTIAALYLLCHVEGNRGQLSSLWMYSGRSSRMALDINLHLRSDKPSLEHPSAAASKEEAARVHAFWGCFIADQVTSFTLGRLPQISTNAITVELPPIDDEVDQEPWLAYDMPSGKRPGARSTTFNQVAALSKIVNSTLQMFFAPAQILSGTTLLDEYQKYLQWFSRLQDLVSSIDDAPPHILCLHMYYHAAVLLLFRPFLKAQFTESKVSPREVCRQSANAISDIFAQHRRLYDLVGIHTFQVHCLSTACTIHIINVPTISSTKYLTAACNSFQDLVHRNEWATGSLNIIKGLVQKWNIILPLEAETALYRNQDTISNFDFGSGSQSASSGAPSERGSAPSFSEKRALFRSPSSQVMQKRQRLAPRETGHQVMNYLFAPSPNQPAPLLGPMHTSTSAETEWNDELNMVAQGFDGLNFLGDDWFDPFMGFQGENSAL